METEIHIPEVFPADPLNQSEQSKSRDKAERDYDQPVRDIVQGHMNSGEIMNKAVERSQSDRRSLRTNGLYIDQADDGCPQDKGCEESDGYTEFRMGILIQF